MQGSMAYCSSFMRYLKCSDLQRERTAAVYGGWEEGMGSNCEVVPRCWLGIRFFCKRLIGRAHCSVFQSPVTTMPWSDKIQAYLSTFGSFLDLFLCV